MLLEAGHEERKVRARVRRSTTLDGARDALLEFENLSEAESQSDFDFEDVQENVWALSAFS